MIHVLRMFRNWGTMAEYLSPGVYVEEFDSGAQPLEGASTSTAGFIGLAQRGELKDVPQLVTGVADFRRIFGSYLSENAFGEYRFLVLCGGAFLSKRRFPLLRHARRSIRCESGDQRERRRTKTPLYSKFSAKNAGDMGQPSSCDPRAIQQSEDANL